VAPVESYLKVRVGKELVDTEHGKIGCAGCHGGKPGAAQMEEAHTGIIRDPTYPDPSKTCGECHADIAKAVPSNLHYTLGSYKVSIEKRAASDPSVRARLAQARDMHCNECHASCGQCHVSRPTSVEGGLLAKHQFQRKPSMTENCTACHGSRVGMEYQGKNTGIPADLHFASEAMTCTDCHKAAEMHGNGSSVHADRYDQTNGPHCLDCHKEALSSKSKNKFHSLHAGKLSCYVCHSVSYKNCYGCHVGKDNEGLPYYKTAPSRMDLKIGLNPNPTSRKPYTFVLVRHVPIDRDTFNYYVPEGLKNFDAFPTWKYTTPHNIQLYTSQNEACENCHGNTKWFLKEEDVDPAEREANRAVIVPADRIPGPVEK
jgi:hypothetical protein